MEPDQPQTDLPPADPKTPPPSPAPEEPKTIARFKLVNVQRDKQATFVPDAPKQVKGKEVPSNTGRHLVLATANYKLVGIAGEGKVLSPNSSVEIKGILDQGWQPGDEILVEIKKVEA